MKTHSPYFRTLFFSHPPVNSSKIWINDVWHDNGISFLKITRTWKRHMMILNRFRNKYPLVKQYDQADCGPACLLSVLKFHGGNDNLVHVRELCQTTSDGTSMLDMVFAAKKLGLEAEGGRGNYEALLNEKMPCIAHVTTDERRTHYVVIYRLSPSHLLLGDPGKGLYKIKKEDFERIWYSNAVIILKPQKILYNKVQTHWINWLFSYFKQESLWINQSVFLGIVYTVLGLITAILIQRLIDVLIPSKNLIHISYFGGLLCLLLLFRASAGYLREKFLVILNKRLSKSINGEFLHHLFKLPKQFFDTRKKGDITARIHDIIRIQQAVLKIAGTLIIDIMVCAGALLMMFYFSTMIGWIMLVFIPLYTTILLFHSRPFKRLQNDVMKGFARVESVYIDSLDGMDDILNFDVSDAFSKTNRLIYGMFQDKIETLGFKRTGLLFFVESSGALITTAVLIFGALAISQDHMKLGEMIACYSLLAYIIPAINRTVEANISMQGAFIAIRRLMDLLLVDQEKDSGDKPFEMKKVLKIEQAKFSWSANRELFQNVDLQLQKGKLISLWGPSGEGKTTLVQMITRKYTPGNGKILLDGVPAEEIKLGDYRKNIAVVPQQVKLFNGTIGENIVLGRPTTSLDEQKDLIHRYGFSGFFSRFEYGLFTRVGEDGRILSGGEKQMVGLARALFNRPEILIIDEGLTALDREIESMIFSILLKYAKTHSVLINTHNLRIIMKTDYLYVLKNGFIIQEGEPNHLFKKEGFFRSVFNDEFLYQGERV
jgi:ATP-binding cassette subfamily B protein